MRVPLGWSAGKDMCGQINPASASVQYDTTQKQTVEMRSPDGSADVYLLIASLAVACRHGFEMENALDIAEQTYVNVNIHKKENKDKLAKLKQLPDSCVASSKCLQDQRAVYEEYNVFSPGMIDSIIARLKAFKDENIRSKVMDNERKMLELVETYFHCG